MEAFLHDPASLFSVRGKVALITGASGAFGALASRVLAGAGARVMLVAGKAAEMAAVEQDCQTLGAETGTVNMRPDDETSCAAIVQAAVDRFGAVDILVVASGMNDVGKITDLSQERFERVMHANVTGSWLMARAAGAQMLQQGTGGKIVLTSSARGLLGHPGGYSAYCASKGAVDGMTKALGCEWEPQGICVNAIAPTVFRSALTAWMYDDSDRGTAVRRGMLSRLPKGRLGEPSDLAGPLLFLSSAASDFYTGHILYADGGYTAG